MDGEDKQGKPYGFHVEMKGTMTRTARGLACLATLGLLELRDGARLPKTNLWLYGNCSHLEWEMGRFLEASNVSTLNSRMSAEEEGEISLWQIPTRIVNQIGTRPLLS